MHVQGVHLEKFSGGGGGEGVIAKYCGIRTGKDVFGGEGNAPFCPLTSK